MDHKITCQSRVTSPILLLVTMTSLVALALSSCISVTEPGYVEKQWSSKIRELAIVPVFPPREDIQVGDVYILPRTPQDLEKIINSKGYIPLGVFACHLNVDAAVDSFYSKRDSFPLSMTNLPTSISSLTNTPYALVDQSRSDTSIYTNNGDNHRLRLVGFPQFMSASFSKGDLSALIPIEAVNLTLGTAYSDQKKATVSIPVAESYGIPATIIQPHFKEKQLDVVPTAPGANWSNFYGLAPPEARVSQNIPGARSYVYGYAITEVYYTRAIDISIQSERGSASRLNASVTGSQVAGKLATQISTNAVGTAPASTNSMGDPVATANTLNSEVAANMNSLLTPGGSISFVSVSDASVSMRRTYVRPVAIGIRAIQFKLYSNGYIEQSGSYSGQVAGFE